METQGAYVIPDFVDLSFSEKEGMTSNYVSHPFPRKGLVYPEAVEANNWIKKILIGLIGSIAHPTTALENFARIAEYSFRNHYLQRRFYNKFSRELWKLTYLFLKKLGVSSDVAYRIGKIVAHIFQFEEAYRFRLEDLFSETTKEALLTGRKELNRLFKIYLRREKFVNVGIGGLDYKFGSAMKLLKFALLFPNVKRAWQFALEEMEIENLQMDNADRYYSNTYTGYDYRDKELDDRFNESVDTYNLHQINKFKESIKNASQTS